MIPNRNSNFFTHIVNEHEKADAAKHLASVNPSIRKNTSVIANKDNFYPENPVMANYNWSWRYFDYLAEQNYPRLTQSIMHYGVNTEKNQIFQSSDGNISLYGVPEKQIHLFSANIFKQNGGIAKLNIDWSNSILINLNGQYLTSNYENFEYNAKRIPVALSTGWNAIDIYLYTPSGNRNFTINSDLGEVSDSWGAPNVYVPLAPHTLSVGVDIESVGKKDSNLNLLRWSTQQIAYSGLYPGDICSYGVFRLGPYNSGLSSPVVVTTLSSGYFVSGVDTLIDDYGRFPVSYYTVSAINQFGEGLGSSERKILQGPEISGSTVLSGFGSSSTGSLPTGVYSYYVLSRAFTGDYVFYGKESLFVENLGTSVEISWEPGLGASRYDIYRLSGISPLSSAEGSFSGIFVTGLDTSYTRFIDSGVGVRPYVTGTNFIYNNNSSFNGEPAIFYPNNSYVVHWSGVTTTQSGLVSYKVYKTLYSGIYRTTSLVAITTGLNYIDSGVSISAQKQPHFYNNIGNVKGAQFFEDPGVFKNKSYLYKVAAISCNGVQGPLSTGYSVTAGDSIAPNAPSGFTGYYDNGLERFTWQNGVEPDLDGTIVYRSDNLTDYYELTRIKGTTYRTFIGYSGVVGFKLANFDTSDNTSSLTSSLLVTGNNTFYGDVNVSGFALSTGYVKRSGDTMFGDLNMQNANIILSGTNTLKSKTDLLLEGENSVSTYTNSSAGTISFNVPNSSELVINSVGGYLFVPATKFFEIIGPANSDFMSFSGSTVQGNKIKFFVAPLPYLSGSVNIGSSEEPFSNTYSNRFFQPYQNDSLISRVATKKLDTSIKSTPYTITSGDSVILGRSGIAITLPSTVGLGEHYWVKNIGSGVVTVNGNGSLIDGFPTQILVSGICIHIVYSAPDWLII